MLKEPLTEEQANKVWDILVEHAGANEHMREDFVHCQTRPNLMTYEWRFVGDLGFGGKFWINNDRWYVSCYRESETPERLVIVKQVNQKLADLKASYQ